MRRAFWMLALAAAVATAAGGVAPAPAFGGCASVVVWHDTAYFRYGWAPGPAPHAEPGPPLRGAVEPGCNDTGGSTPSPASVGAWAIRGVPTEVAILSQGGILVAPGYFPQVPGFPLIRPGAPLVDVTRNCRLGAPLVLSGRALPDAWGLRLGDVRSSPPVPLFDHQLTGLFVDAHTTIAGLSRHGLGYIGVGQAVRIDARRCGRTIVARRIAAAGPTVPASTAEDILGPGWRGDGGITHQLGGTPRVVTAVVVLAVAGVVVFFARARRRRSPKAGAG